MTRRDRDNVQTLRRIAAGMTLLCDSAVLREATHDPNSRELERIDSLVRLFKNHRPDLMSGKQRRWDDAR